MRKLFIFLLGVSITSVIVALSSSSASANHQEQVLGVATAAEKLSIPPTAEGPGFILPDSPLYFLDGIKQKVRLLLAFTPEQKAKVHAIVAGERLAELQLMLARDNIKGIRTALQGMSDNFREASENLAEAKLSGRDISNLSKSINDSIKKDHETLSILEKIATGEIKAQVLAARESLKASKVTVEDYLPADLLINEMQDDLNIEIDDNINKAKVSAAGINRAIEVLTRLASEAARENQPARQKALMHAIEVKNLVSQFENASTRMQKEEPTPTPTKPVSE
ncbi:MAG: DUF5667 domain-containing protein [Candidatus Levybacteria bacterium]|nr:DUF5667 domain-containing protein [Candidatus Levybacteria bacterium]